jgi:hypothetical protein
MISLISVQNDLNRFKKQVEECREKYEQAMNKRRALKEKDEQDVKDIINKISRVNLKSRVFFIQESISQRQEMLKKLDEKVKTSKMTSEYIKSSKKEISFIKSKLQLLKPFIPDCGAFSEPLNEENVKKIIASFAKLKFQEHSLSVKFQNLTEEQAVKRRIFDEISAEVSQLKDAEKDVPNSGLQHLTLNQIRQFMESDQESAKSTSFEVSQVTLMRVYLNVANIANTLSRLLQFISSNSSFHTQDNAIVFALNVIKRTQQGFSHKNYRVKQGKNTELKIEKKKTFKTEVEGMEEIQQFSKSVYEIEEMLGRFMTDEKLVRKVAKIIKEDSVACLFLDPTDAELRLYRFIQKPTDLVIEINSIGNAAAKDKISQLLGAILDITKSIFSFTSSHKAEVDLFNSNFSKQSAKFKERASADSFSDLNDKFKQKPPRKSCEDGQKYKIIDTIKSANEEPKPKTRQELPKTVSISTTSQKEIVNLLNEIRIKVSNFKTKERILGTSSQKNINFSETKKPWLKSSKISSLSSSRPFTVNFQTSLL